MIEQYEARHVTRITDSVSSGDGDFDACGALLRAIVADEAAEYLTSEFRIQAQRQGGTLATGTSAYQFAEWAKFLTRDSAGDLLPDATIEANFDAALVKAKAAWSAHSATHPADARFYQLVLASYYYA